MTDDLVSGVLTRISEIEKEALSISAGRFVEGLAGRQVDPDLNRYLDTICDPDEVLRLCRAHRQIVDERQKAAMHLRWTMANEGRGEYDARRELARWDQVVSILAVGLGVLEEETDD